MLRSMVRVGAGGRATMVVASPAHRGLNPQMGGSQVRNFRHTRPLHGAPLAFVGLWVAKKTVVFLAASLYGFKRLYRRMYRINMKYTPKSLVPTSKYFLRHTFDATLKVASWLDFRAKSRISRAPK
eukprot:TRINITY_DN1084_c2_g1_i1.p1 TRINITY_DN1084_c2_g1~~TRINITY_DN1084_c2_g1_i1.p1  ORF type:complete len:126 (+),score=12.83 TRINITY_DN1084_c2_g1_i1:68-445(+)